MPNPESTTLLARFGLALAALLVGLATWGAVTGNLQVTVRDHEGAILPGATVVIESPAQLGERSAFTNRQGIARFNALAPGTYKVRVSFPSAATTVQDGIEVRLDATTAVDLRLPASITESVTVIAETPVIDFRSTSIGQDLDVEYVEDLPTVRTYQTNLQLIPGVDVGSGGNPVVHGGTSRDNLFLIDGINTTDPVTQTFGANINFDIIDEQQVSTGGHRAEFGGVVGAVSNLVTKSGGNDWSGQANYFATRTEWTDSIEDLSVGGNTANAWSTAYTLGGPVVRDRLWHFTSWERNDTETFTVTGDGSLSAPRTFESDYYFGKLTLQATPDHKFNLQFSADPTDIPNSNAGSLDIKPEQLSFQEQGGTNTSLRYTGVLGSNLVLEAQATVVRNDLDVFPVFPGAGPNVSSLFSSVTEQFGRFGNEQFSDRDRDELKADLSWFLQSGWGEHDLKFGVQATRTDFRSLNINSGAEAFTDIPGGGISAAFNDLGDLIQIAPGFVAFRWEQLAAIHGFDCSIGGVACEDNPQNLPSDPTQWEIDLPDGAGGFTTFNANDFIFPASINAEAAARDWLRFQRSVDSQLGLASPVGQEILALYAQDDWRIGRWSTYLGLRVEEQRLEDSRGNEYFEFDTTFSPRIGVTYDLRGDGKQKLYAHAGRLYDPVADATTSFGNPVGDPLLELQLWVDPLQDFLTFFRVGGPGTGSAVVAPNIETPVTDELLLGYAVAFGDSLSLEATLIHRETTDIIEDLDPTRGLLDGSPSLAGLGFADTNGDGVVDGQDLSAAFVIYNPPGGEREYDGLDLTLRKRFTRDWAGLFGYTYSDFTGNVSEDSQFGILGDDSFLDPRLRHNNGRLGDVFGGGGVGANEHLFRLSGSYRFPIGLTVGSTLTAQSGTFYSLRSVLTPDGNTGDSRTPTIWDGDPATIVRTLGVDRNAFSQALGIPVGPDLDAAIVEQIPLDLRSGRGAYENSWVYFWNVSLRYGLDVVKRLDAEVFVDVFNPLDLQDTITRDGDLATTAQVTPENVGDRSIYTFQRALRKQAPRSFQLGFRLGF